MYHVKQKSHHWWGLVQTAETFWERGFTLNLLLPSKSPGTSSVLHSFNSLLGLESGSSTKWAMLHWQIMPML